METEAVDLPDLQLNLLCETFDTNFFFFFSFFFCRILSSISWVGPPPSLAAAGSITLEKMRRGWRWTSSCLLQMCYHSTAVSDDWTLTAKLPQEESTERRWRCWSPFMELPWPEMVYSLKRRLNWIQEIWLAWGNTTCSCLRILQANQDHSTRLLGWPDSAQTLTQRPLVFHAAPWWLGKSSRGSLYLLVGETWRALRLRWAMNSTRRKESYNRSWTCWTPVGMNRSWHRLSCWVSASSTQPPHLSWRISDSCCFSCPIRSSSLHG